MRAFEFITEEPTTNTNRTNRALQSADELHTNDTREPGNPNRVKSADELYYKIEREPRRNTATQMPTDLDPELAGIEQNRNIMPKDVNPDIIGLPKTPIRAGTYITKEVPDSDEVVSAGEVGEPGRLRGTGQGPTQQDNQQTVTQFVNPKKDIDMNIAKQSNINRSDNLQNFNLPKNSLFKKRITGK